MIRLALETATHWLGVAALDGERVLVEYSERRPMSQSSGLMPAIRATLAEAGLSPRALGELAVSQGPGSFTGLRVGAATGRALADALGLPVVPVPTLLALALGAGPLEGGGLALLAGPRNEGYAQGFEWRDGLPVALGTPAVLPYAALPEALPQGWVLVCEGDAAAGLERCGVGAPPAARVVTPSARWVGCYAERVGPGGPAREFEPVYGKSPIYRKRVRPA